MSVQYNINPLTISRSTIVSYTASDDALVSFCTRFSIVDPNRPNEIANYMDFPVAIRVDVLERFQILGLLEESYGVEAFLCDTNNVRIEQPKTTTQGSMLRICIHPDSIAQKSGVVMKSINRIKLIRDDISQDLIVPNGVIQDVVMTRYHCVAGESLCNVESEISNRFFTSEGVVRLEGEVWLQYAFSDSRRLLGISLRKGTDPKYPEFLSSFPLPARSRKAAQSEAGDFIGSRDFELDFEVIPSKIHGQAEAFLCDGRNERLQGEALTRPRRQDEEIRVCFVPQSETRESGIYLRQIASFFFEQGGNVQFAVEPTGVQPKDSLVICNPGEPICVLTTELSSIFFSRGMNVVAEGEVLFQYGTDPLPGLQDTTVDSGFAGRAKVSLKFTTISPDDSSSVDKWWYVIVAVLGFFVLMCSLVKSRFGNRLPRVAASLNRFRTNRGIFLSKQVVGIDPIDENGPSILKQSTPKTTASRTTADDPVTPTSSGTRGRLASGVRSEKKHARRSKSRLVAPRHESPSMKRPKAVPPEDASGTAATSDLFKKRSSMPSTSRDTTLAADTGMKPSVQHEGTSMTIKSPGDKRSKSLLERDRSSPMSPSKARETLTPSKKAIDDLQSLRSITGR